MTAVNNLSSNAINMQAIMGTNAVRGNDGDGDGSGSAGNVRNKGASFLQAVQQSLSQLTGNNSNPSSNSSTQNSQAAIQSFMQSLLAALHQAGLNNGAASSQQANADGDNDGSKGKVSAAQTAQYTPTAQTDLQALLQQVSSSSSSNTGLQQNFQGMLTALGASGNANSLNGFLQSLAANIQGSSLVSTTA